MTINDIVQIVDGKIYNSYKNAEINNIRIDTRRIEKDDLYIAIKGNNFDGHNFIKKAAELGAIAAVIDQDLDFESELPLIKVKDTLATLGVLGNYFRLKHPSIPLIAVTGSVGKTTTKELISSVLECKYKVLKSVGNYNNHIGLPLTLFNLNNSYEIVVVELGMNHLKEISRLSKICLPNVGIITNIGTAHIGNLGSQKNIFKAKTEILEGMDNGYLLVNGNDKYLKKIKNKKNKIIKCGRKDLKPFNIDKEKNGFDLKINGRIYHFTINLLGEKMIDNALLAIKVGIMYDISIVEIQKVLSNYKVENKRLNIYHIGNLEIIDDCYNASLESITNSLCVLNQRKNNKIIVLGDVLELGEFSKKYHKKIEKLLKKVKKVEFLLVGKEVRNIKLKGAKYFENNHQVIEYLKKINLDEKSILIKGSRNMHLEEIKEFLLTK